MNRFTKIVFIFASLSLAISAGSQPIISDFQVNENGINRWDQSSPMVLVLDNNNYVVFWLDSRKFLDPNVTYAQIFDSDGNPLDDNFHLEGIKSFSAATADTNGHFIVIGSSTTVTYLIAQRFDNEGTPVGEQIPLSSVGGEVAWGDSGKFMIAWTDNRNGFYTDIYARYFAADGTSLTDDFKVNDDYNTNIVQRNPSIAANSSGDYIITWEDGRVDFNGRDIYAQRYDKNGEKVGVNFRVDIDSPAEYIRQTNPVCAMNDSGKVVIAWNTRHWDHSNPNFYAQCFDGDENRLGSNFRITDENDSLVYYEHSSVALNDQGNFLFTWQDRRTDKDNIFAKYYTIDGTIITEDQKITDVEQEIWNLSPDVAADNNSDFILTWVDNRGNEYGTNIYMQKFGEGGSLIGDNFHTTNEDTVIVMTIEQDPSIIVHSDGTFTIFWEGERDSEVGDIFGQRYTANGATINSNFLVNDDQGENGQQAPLAVMNNNVLTLVTWMDGRDDFDAIYGQLYSSSASIGRNFKITDDSTDIASKDYAIASFEDDKFIIVWRDKCNGFYDVYGRTFDSNGVALDSSFKVNDDEGSDFYPAVAANDSGKYLIAWTDASHEDYWSIYAQLFTSQGDTMGINFKVSETTGNENLRYPMITSIDSGQFLITWVDYISKVYYAQMVAGNGTLIGSNYQIPKFDTMAKDQDDNSIVVWSQGGLYAQRYNRDGDMIGNSFKISGNTSDPQEYSPDIKLFDNKIYTTWVEQDRLDEGSGRNIWANILDWDNPVQTSINNINHTPADYALYQNYPNPFNPSTTIRFTLPTSKQVKIEVYNIIGQKIETLLNKPMRAGYHEVEFNGQSLPSGIYLYRINAGTWTDTKKMLLVK